VRPFAGVRALFLLAALAACNALVFGDVEKVIGKATKDAATDDPPDGEDPPEGNPDAGPRSDPTKPFDAPELGADFDPATRIVRDAIQSPDGLEAYFIAGPSGSNLALRRLHRTSRTAKWEAATTIAITPPPLTALSMSAGGLKLHYDACSVRDSGLTECENFVSVRASTAVLFSGASTVFVSKSNVQTDLFVVASDDAAFYSDLLPDSGGNAAIVRTPLSAGGPIFNLRQPVTNASIPGSDDSSPILNVPETVMYLSSNRPGGSGGSYDVWTTRRGTKTGTFKPPVFVPELSAAGIDSVSWVSDDDCEVYLNRSDHVYRAARPALE
jgi:hypothetical protein